MTRSIEKVLLPDGNTTLGRTLEEAALDKCTRQETGLILENEIRQLERSVNTLVCRPTLIRREYWAAQTEKLLVFPGLSSRDRRRLTALLDLLAITTREEMPRSGSPAKILNISAEAIAT